MEKKNFLNSLDREQRHRTQNIDGMDIRTAHNSLTVNRGLIKCSQINIFCRHRTPFDTVMRV